jgi:hypothetical protein
MLLLVAASAPVLETILVMIVGLISASTEPTDFLVRMVV